MNKKGGSTIPRGAAAVTCVFFNCGGTSAAVLKVPVTAPEAGAGFFQNDEGAGLVEVPPQVPVAGEVLKFARCR